MESYYCEHHRDINNDKNLLLDDENALLAGDYKTCFHCKRQAANNGICLPMLAPSFNIEDANRQSDMNGGVMNNVFLNAGGESRLSVNSTDSLDAPLLLNERYNQFDGVEEFHCHMNTIKSQDNKALRKLLAACCMCLFFMITELLGGYIANSLSVMTDAAHLMSDFVGFLVSLFSIWLGRRAKTTRMSFGFHRAEVLGALFSIIVIWMLTGIFLYLAMFRLINGKYEINVDAMMIVSTIGVFINIVMGLILHDFPSIHSHSHSFTQLQSEQSTGIPLTSAKPHSNINVRAAVIHVLGDFIQSIGVLVASIIIKFYPSAKIADPICTFIFSIIVILTTKNVLRDTLNILMEGVPVSLNYAAVVIALRALDGVRHVHDLRIWSLTVDKNALCVHLAVDKFCDKEEVLSQATRLIKCKFAITDATIQIEKFNADLINNCSECYLPKN